MSGITVFSTHQERLVFSDVPMLVLAIFMMSGYTASNTLYIAIALLMFWLLLQKIAYNRKAVFKTQNKTWTCVLIYAGYLFIVGLPNGNLYFSMKQVGAMLILYSPILFYLQCQSYCYDKKRKILQIILVACIVFNIVSLFAYEQWDINARALASNRDRYGDIAIGGGYGLAYSSAILSVVFLDLIAARIVPPAFRIHVNLFVVAIMGAVVFFTRSTVTLLCWIVGLFVCFLLRPLSKNKRGLRVFIRILLIALIVLLIIIAFGIDDIGLWLLEKTSNSNDQMTRRLNSFASWLTYGSERSDSEYFLGRFDLPAMSLETFIRNPVFGVAHLHGNNYTSSRAYGISQHGEWADALGNYGLLGGIPFLLIYIYSISNTVKMQKGKLSIAWCVILILIGVFNPIRGYNVNLTVFYIIPMLLDVVSHSNDGMNFEHRKEMPLLGRGLTRSVNR